MASERESREGSKREESSRERRRPEEAGAGQGWFESGWPPWWWEGPWTGCPISEECPEGPEKMGEPGWNLQEGEKMSWLWKMAAVVVAQGKG